MPEKSFVEYERAREAAIRRGPILQSRLDKLKEKCKNLKITPAQKDVGKKISTALAYKRLGINPYHDDFELLGISSDICQRLIEDSIKALNESLPSANQLEKLFNED